MSVTHPTADGVTPIQVSRLGLAMAMTRLVTSFLYGVKPNDPLTLALAAAALAGVAAAAG